MGRRGDHLRRILAIVERELRRFRRRPTVMIMALVFPLVQLVVLGHAFGGSIRHLKVGLVDRDGGAAALSLRALARRRVAGAPAFDIIHYADEPQALRDLRRGRLNGVLTIPPQFSLRTEARGEPRLALIADNTDNFVAAALTSGLRRLLDAHNEARNPDLAPRLATLDVVEPYPYVPYIQYVLSGSITLSIFMMVTIGGGIIYIDDKARGLHEGYLVTPIRKFELIVGFNLAGTIMAVIAGVVLTTVGSLITGLPGAFDPARLLRMLVVIVCTGFALVSLTFLMMVRVNDPFVPRAIFAVLNTLLFFPSGAVYPREAFPDWMQAMAHVNPFTYAVHAFKALLLRNAGLDAVQADLLYLAAFSVLAMAAVTALFKRTL